jgi:CRP-like cAMP-binding protein
MSRLPDLTHHPLFEGLGDEAMKLLRRLFQIRDLGPGEAVVHQGSIAKRFYLLLSGAVWVYVNDARVAELQQGAHFGELFLFGHGLRTASVITETACSVASIEDLDLDILRRQHEADYHHFMANLAVVLAERLAETTAAYADLLRQREQDLAEIVDLSSEELG